MNCDHDIYYEYGVYNTIDKDQDTLSSDIDRILHSDEDSMHLDDFSRRMSQDVELKADLNTHLQEIQDELMEESSLTDLLLAAAEAVQAKNPAMALALVERLNNSKNEIFENGDSFNRLAFFFTQAIHSISTNCINHDLGVQNRGMNPITAFQMLQELSPYVKFAHFTANQAILEATEGNRSIHVVDFDIMEGIQWPSLMSDLAARKGIVTSLRITAVSTKRHIFQQTGRRLKEFADSIGLDFAFDQIAIEDEFERIRRDCDSVIVANCMMNQFYMPQRSLSEIKTFLKGVQRLDPKIIVLVEEELFKGIQSMSFVEFFCEALHHYNALSDSLIGGLCGGYKITLRLIEKEFIRVRISESLRNFQNFQLCEVEKDGFLPLKGLRSIPMSYSNVSQARFLVSLFSGGYWLQHEKGSLSLCWKSKPLTTATILVPIKTKSCS